MVVAIAFGSVCPLTVVGTQREHTVVTGTFQPLGIDLGEKLLHRNRRVVVEGTDVTLVAHGTV